MARVSRLKLVNRRAAHLSGTVARQSDCPRSTVEEYVRSHVSLPQAELAAAWLAGWDDADLRLRLRLPSAYAPPCMVQERRADTHP